MLFRDYINVQTKKGISNVDLTKDIVNIISKSGVKEGLCSVFCEHTTAGLIINERDLMLLKDFERYIKNEIPEDKLYQHPSNGHSHLRSLFSNTEVTIPVSEGKPVLGQWQSIMLWEFDVDDRDRTIAVTVMGE